MLICMILLMEGATVNTKYGNPLALCIRVPSYLRRHTRLCTRNAKMMTMVLKGSHLASSECQRQFEMRPWNCTDDRESLSRMIIHAFQETGYLYAIQSSGVAYSLAQACSKGLLKRCRCPAQKVKFVHTRQSNRPLRRTKKSVELDRRKYEKFEMGEEVEYSDRAVRKLEIRMRSSTPSVGCVESSVNFGITEASWLLMNLKSRDSRALLDEHNKRAGRLALNTSEVQSPTRCRCHGVSGACAAKICTRDMPKYRSISDFLMNKYQSAISVTSDNNGGFKLRHSEESVQPDKLDIVYVERSPPFCERNPRIGSLGTKSRECIPGDRGEAGCDKMCCNRGYTRVELTQRQKCKCVFSYCCLVKCKQCERTEVKYVCK